MKSVASMVARAVILVWVLTAVTFVLFAPIVLIQEVFL